MGEVKDESGPRTPAQAVGLGAGGDGKHPTPGLGPFAKPQRISRKVGTVPASARGPPSQGDENSS